MVGNTHQNKAGMAWYRFQAELAQLGNKPLPQCDHGVARLRHVGGIVDRCGCTRLRLGADAAGKAHLLQRRNDIIVRNRPSRPADQPVRAPWRMFAGTTVLVPSSTRVSPV